MDTQTLQTVDLEYRLQIAAHLDCWCSRYLADRREVLIPELIRRFVRSTDFDGDACTFVAAFVGRLHEKKCPTMVQPESFMVEIVRHIRDTIGEDPEGEVEPVDGPPEGRRMPRRPFEDRSGR